MAVKLSSGKEHKADLYKMTTLEWYGMKTMTNQEADAVVAKVYGLTVEEFQALPYPDHYAVVQDFFKAVQDPLADPS